MKDEALHIVKNITDKVDELYALLFESEFNSIADSEEFMNLHYSAKQMLDKIKLLPNISESQLPPAETGGL